VREDTHALRLSRVAHELRGLAGVALGATNELRASLGVDGNKFADMAQRGLDRVLRVADRLGRASSIQRQLVEFRREPDDFSAFVAQEMAKSKALEHQIHIEVTLNRPDKPVKAGFDHDWLGFALREIIANAIQYARKKVNVTLVQEGDVAVMIVEDDGPGFRDHIELTFDAEPNPRRGVGLSLPVCRHVVEDGHMGKLTISNQDSGGARVELRLPATHGRVEAKK
jgi:signal transduction histidine kinase